MLHSRATCSARDIQDLVCHRVQSLICVQDVLDDISVRSPVRIPPDRDGCNWTIDVQGVPLEADQEVAEVVRVVRTYVNLPDNVVSVQFDRGLMQSRKDRLMDAAVRGFRSI
jgi:hypothetical protein